MGRTGTLREYVQRNVSIRCVCRWMILVLCLYCFFSFFKSLFRCFEEVVAGQGNSSGWQVGGLYIDAGQ